MMQTMPIVLAARTIRTIQAKISRPDMVHSQVVAEINPSWRARIEARWHAAKMAISRRS